jgi:hypothetical protein
VVLLLLSLKVAFPDRVVLLRGNHEFREMNESMGEQGFPTACWRHAQLGAHAEAALTAIYDAFDWLPFAALAGDSVLILHGGIGALTLPRANWKPVTNSQATASGRRTSGRATWSGWKRPNAAPCARCSALRRPTAAARPARSATAPS